MRAPFSIQSTKIVLCEGLDERNLIRRMKADELVTNDVQIIAFEDLSAGAGFGALKKSLVALSGYPDFDKVTSIGILVDNDLDHFAAVNAVAQAVQDANAVVDPAQRFSVPTVPFIKQSGLQVDTLTHFYPGNAGNGCLETTVLAVLSDLHPAVMNCVDGLINCSGIAWSVTKIHKAKVRSAISVLHEQKPGVALSFVFKDGLPIIPVSHAAFDPIRAFAQGV